jgi:regulator of replication initiation timing
MDVGVFSVLTQYGVLGLAVIALGYLCWRFITKMIEENDDLKIENRDLREDHYEKVTETVKEHTTAFKALKDALMLLIGKKN